MTTKIIIPQNLRGKDIWSKDPNKVPADKGGYFRKEGAKFVMDDELSQKDRQFLVDCGIALVVTEVKAPPKTKKKDKAE